MVLYGCCGCFMVCLVYGCLCVVVDCCLFMVVCDNDNNNDCSGMSFCDDKTASTTKITIARIITTMTITKMAITTMTTTIQTPTIMMAITTMAMFNYSCLLCFLFTVTDPWLSNDGCLFVIHFQTTMTTTNNSNNKQQQEQQRTTTTRTTMTTTSIYSCL